LLFIVFAEEKCDGRTTARFSMLDFQCAQRACFTRKALSDRETPEIWPADLLDTSTFALSPVARLRDPPNHLQRPIDGSDQLHLDHEPELRSLARISSLRPISSEK